MKTCPARLFTVLPMLLGCSVLTWAATANAGRVLAWGKNDFGQINVPADLPNTTAVAAGFSHSLALLEDGTVIGWGKNLDGQTNAPAGLKATAKTWVPPPKAHAPVPGMVAPVL